MYLFVGVIDKKKPYVKKQRRTGRRQGPHMVADGNYQFIVINIVLETPTLAFKVMLQVIMDVK